MVARGHITRIPSGHLKNIYIYTLNIKGVNMSLFIFLFFFSIFFNEIFTAPDQY